MPEFSEFYSRFSDVPNSYSWSTTGTSHTEGFLAEAVEGVEYIYHKLKTDNKCFFCKKKLGKQFYKVSYKDSIKEQELKICNNCQYLFKILKREIERGKSETIDNIKTFCRFWTKELQTTKFKRIIKKE